MDAPNKSGHDEEKQATRFDKPWISRYRDLVVAGDSHACKNNGGFVDVARLHGRGSRATGQPKLTVPSLR